MKNKLYIEHMPTGCDTCPHNYKSARNYSKCNLTRHYTTGQTQRLGTCPLRPLRGVIDDNIHELYKSLQSEHDSWRVSYDEAIYESKHDAGIVVGLNMACIHVKNFRKGEVE